MIDADQRPYCRKTDCSDLADVIVLKRPSAISPAFAYCDAHNPDPTVHGNKTAWKDKFTLVRFGVQPPEYTVYGRPGSSSWRGVTMHIERPDSLDVLCHHDARHRLRFDLSRAVGDEYALCRPCLSSSNWVPDIADLAAAGYLYNIRKIASREGELPDQADRYLDYPEPDSLSSHILAEFGSCIRGENA